MTLQVQGGWLDGNYIRRSRKATKCMYWRGKSAGGTCRKPIAVGDFYVEGEKDDWSGNPWAVEKYCPCCAGPEALATVALIGC